MFVVKLYTTTDTFLVIPTIQVIKMDRILKPIRNIVNVFHLLKIGFEEHEEMDVLSRDTLEFEDDSPASISSGIYEDPEDGDCKTNNILLDVTYVRADGTITVHSSSGI